MIDYLEIGTRIREARLAKGLKQEQLAELVNVGTTHISHIETGNTVPSLKTFVAIVNALDCSADELLCREIKSARPILTSWIAEQFEDCTEIEAKIITDTLDTLKKSLRKHCENL